MTTTNPTLLAMPIAKNGTKNTIPATQAAAGNGLMSQSTGFPPETALPLGAGGVAPSREDFNGAFNLLGGVAYYAQKGWTFHYDATQDYFAGCVVIDPDDGKRYECIADMPVADTIAPHSDTSHTYWKAFSLGGVSVGFIMPYAGTGLQEGWLDCDGSAVSRTMYPDLFDAIGTTWGAGDGSTTFNLPRSEDLVLQGASTTNPVGTYLSAGLPNIEGEISNPNVASGAATKGDREHDVFNGAFSSEYRGRAEVGAGSATYVNGYSLSFDASLSNPIYGNSATVQPPAACVRFMIKAFDGQTPDSALIDITQYAADLANKADRSLSNLTQAGEDHFLEQDFTIIYPNGGTEANPANITGNSRYVETNPFHGYVVACAAEIEINGDWGVTGWVYDQATSYGILSAQLDNDSIVIQTGDWLISGESVDDGSPFGRTGHSISSAPCRVKVWKIGKVASA